ncbi:Protein QmcA [Phycisphaerales bacterium]|nr:Protein QmcA [Phycisphaerales bacterium]
MEPIHIFLIAIVFLALIVLWLSVVRVGEGSVKLVERFGRYHRTIHPGINFIVPGLDAIKRNATLYTMVRGGKERKPLVAPDGSISTSEEMLDPPEFHSIAKDNTTVNPDLICYFRLVEPQKAVYRIGNLCEAMMQLLETTLRQEVGKLDSDTLIVSRDVIGANVQRHLEQASEAWGAKILRVEIQELRFTGDVQEKLTKAREAELSRRARVVTAQQERDTEILLAEGKKRAAVLVAEGAFEAAKLRAEGDFLLASRRLQGEAEGTRALADALKHNPEVMVAIKALEAQKSVAESLGKSNNSLIIPTELAGLLGAIGAIKSATTFMASTAKVGNGQLNGLVEPKPLESESRAVLGG